MRKVAIIGLGWLEMPLALSLTARGWYVTGSKTTQDNIDAATLADNLILTRYLRTVFVSEVNDARCHRYSPGK